MRCPQCQAPVIGEMQNFCKECLYTFSSGGDRWFSLDDEGITFKEIDN